MRGGALAPFAWALLLVLLGAINWIWTGDAIQVGTFGFAALAILSLAAGLVRAAPEARQRGAPEPQGEPEPIPQMSLGAVIAGLAVAAIVLGLAFGHFAIYFGAGLLLVALGRLSVELTAQRRTRDRWRSR
jgi:multisubunit Na+/H+ antiporter MnhC subunit